MFKSRMTTLYVSDMDRAVDFCTRVLGLEVTYRAGNHRAAIDAGDPTGPPTSCPIHRAAMAGRTASNRCLSRWRNYNVSMKRSARKPKTYHLPLLIEQDEDGVFIVSVPTLRGCRSYGQTLDEVLKNISEAATLCLEDEAPATHGRFVGVRDLAIVA